MKRSDGHAKTGFALALVFSTAAFSVCAAGVGDSPGELDRGIIEKVMILYGLDEEAAIQRLAAEQEASDQYMRIKHQSIEGFAGAWFDGGTQRLHVALSNDISKDVVARIGAVPVIVAWSLQGLEALQARIADEETSPLPADALRTAYIDYRNNHVVVEVEPGRVEDARALLSEDIGRIEIREAVERPTVSSDVRGADGTRNATWASQYGGSHPCSIGVSVENGYYWSGHCGNLGNDITDVSGNPLGSVKGRGHPAGGGYKDIGRVEVDLGWVPTPKINGYSDGLLYVSGKWSGLVESLSGQTVCRYGQTSGGPHCGTLDAILPYEDFSIGRVYHVARVIGGCTHHGDSGGPWLSGVGNQVQGTHIGGTALGTCPLSTTYTYYQPISDHVSAYGLMSGNVLTSHGAVKATVNGWNCPDPISAPGSFNCSFDDYESQGDTSFIWYINNIPVASSSLYIYDVCSTGSLVRVKLTVTNPYGTTTKSTLFNCP